MVMARQIRQHGPQETVVQSASIDDSTEPQPERQGSAPDRELKDSELPPSRNLFADLIGASCIAAVGVTTVVLGATAPPTARALDPLGPMGAPIGIGVIITLLALVQVIFILFELRKGSRYGAAEGASDEPGHPASFRRVLIIMAGCVAYVPLISFFGYLLVTPVAAACGLYLMGYKRYPILALSAIGYTVATFLIFSKLLMVPLPHGATENLLLDLQIISGSGY